MKLADLFENTSPIEVLRAFALANYEEGGDEVYETYDDADYVEVLQTCSGDVEQAKSQLKKFWTDYRSIRDDIRGS